MGKITRRWRVLMGAGTVAGGLGLLALFALSSTAGLPPNGVGGQQVKPNSLGARHIGPESIGVGELRTAFQNRIEERDDAIADLDERVSALEDSDGGNGGNGGNGGGDADPGCEDGHVKAFAQIDVGEVDGTFSPVAGYNCTGGTTQARTTAPGVYEIRWQGIPITSTTDGLVAHATPTGGAGNVSAVTGASASDDLIIRMEQAGGTLVPRTFGASLINIGE